MGAYKYYNPTTQQWEMIKAKTIVKPDGSLEYTPDDIKGLEDDLVAHKAEEATETELGHVRLSDISITDPTTGEKYRWGVENGLLFLEKVGG